MTHMQKPRKLSRTILILAVVGLLVAAVVLLMAPKPLAVDLGGGLGIARELSRRKKAGE